MESKAVFAFLAHLLRQKGCFLKWWYPPFHTPKWWSFLLGKPTILGNPQKHHETPICLNRWARKAKTALLSIESLLFHSDPNNGLSQSPISPATPLTGEPEPLPEHRPLKSIYLEGPLERMASCFFWGGTKNKDHLGSRYLEIYLYLYVICI